MSTTTGLILRLNKIVTGALRSAVAAHGPITAGLIPSATKRVTGALCAADGVHITLTSPPAPSGWQQRIAAHWMSEAERLKTLAERHPSGSTERVRFYSHRERLIACAEDVIASAASDQVSREEVDSLWRELRRDTSGRIRPVDLVHNDLDALRELALRAIREREMAEFDAESAEAKLGQNAKDALPPSSSVVRPLIFDPEHYPEDAAVQREIEAERKGHEG